MIAKTAANTRVMVQNILTCNKFWKNGVLEKRSRPKIRAKTVIIAVTTRIIIIINDKLPDNKFWTPSARRATGIVMPSLVLIGIMNKKMPSNDGTINRTWSAQV